MLTQKHPTLFAKILSGNHVMTLHGGKTQEHEKKSDYKVSEQSTPLTNWSFKRIRMCILVKDVYGQPFLQLYNKRYNTNNRVK